MDVIEHGNPLFYDKIASDLNEQLFNLGHIDDLYPVCFVGYDSEETYPEIYINDGSKINLRVLPDSTKSLSFFVVGDMIQIDEDDRNLSVSMAYLVWMNLLKVDPGKKYDYTSEIIKDSYNVLDAYGCYDMSVNVNTPFEEFTQMSKEVSANTMRPYSGFRINFTKTINVCKT